MAEPRGYVPSPLRHPRRGGIKTVADWVETDRLKAVQAVDWTSEPCTFPAAAPGLCWGVTVAGEKDTTAPSEFASGTVFALYAGDECFLGSELDHEARARAVLEAGEDRAVEERLVAFLATKDATATDFGTFPAAFAAAEAHADLNYVGRPTIVMNRGDVSAAGASRVLFADREGNLVTANGTPVLASAKVPAGDLYVSGNITVFTSGAFVVNTVQHWQINRELAIAERAYALGIDCDYVVAYSVTEVP